MQRSRTRNGGGCRAHRTLINMRRVYTRRFEEVSVTIDEFDRPTRRRKGYRLTVTEAKKIIKEMDFSQLLNCLDAADKTFRQAKRLWLQEHGATHHL